MTSARELAHGREPLRRLIEFALSEDWQVQRTPKGHLKFTKPGHPHIYTGTTASDHRVGNRDITHQADGSFIERHV